MFFDGRKAPRFAIMEPVSVIINGNEIKEVKSRDLSERGMCLLFKKQPPESEYGTIIMKKKIQKRILHFEAEFRKIWVRPAFVDKKETFMGILFSGIESNQYKTLHEIMTN